MSPPVAEGSLWTSAGCAMSSRLERLFILLESGSSPGTRRAAALQLGGVVAARPGELRRLLQRIQVGWGGEGGLVDGAGVTRPDSVGHQGRRCTGTGGCAQQVGIRLGRNNNNKRKQTNSGKFGQNQTNRPETEKKRAFLGKNWVKKWRNQAKPGKNKQKTCELNRTLAKHGETMYHAVLHCCV